MKNDATARSIWGAATYEAIPKSVFAVVAWYLADCASNAGVGNGGEINRFLEELDAMQANGILDEKQIAKVKAAILAAKDQ